MSKENKQDDKSTPAETVPAGAKERVLTEIKEVGSVVLHHAATLIAVLAIVVALIAMYEITANQNKLAEATAKMNDLSARLAASKTAFEKYQAAVMQEKAQKDEERKKLDDVLRQVIQSVSQQQVKMKISPTLEEVLNTALTAQPASAVDTAKMLAAPIAAPVAAEKKAPAAPEKPAQKLSPQTQSIKEAIQKFNQ